ncbi:MAG: OmpH family outer membrane protein [Chitinophagaceae bacterium]|jgi:outer membrane protein|nr:MAG: OmpH family outer membrane protein [Chitinophagaceae bacterium]
MKKLIILAAVILVATFSALSANAQKIGYVDMQDIISLMPETAQADSALSSYRDNLVETMQTMNQEFQTKANTFVKDSLKMNEAIKEAKRSELRDLQNRIGQLQQTSQQQMQQEQQQLLQPIIEKAQKAVSEVAKVKGYTYVLDDSQGGGGNILIVKPATDDLTAEVKARLRLKGK